MTDEGNNALATRNLRNPSGDGCGLGDWRAHTMSRKVYVLAQNQAEADKLYASGCGYDSRKAAEQAKASPEIDSYYANLMKIYEFAEQRIG
jgi:hypothetical protein